MKELKDYEYYRNDLGVVYCGKNEKVLPLLKEKIDLIYTDPPYNFKINSSSYKSFYRRPGQITIMEKLRYSFGHDFKPGPFLINILNLKIKMNLYVWTNKKLIPQYLNWAIDHKFTFNILTWHKINRPPLCKNNYLPDTEYLLFFRKKGAYFNSNLNCIAKYRKYWITPVTTIKKYDHPTPKPFEITLAPIEISCPPAGIVLDPYCGTGTTLKAAIRLDRRFIGIDDTEKYCEITAQRLEKEIRQIKTGKRK